MRWIYTCIFIIFLCGCSDYNTDQRLAQHEMAINTSTDNISVLANNDIVLSKEIMRLVDILKQEHNIIINLNDRLTKLESNHK